MQITVQSQTQNLPNFSAIKVKKIKPFCETEDVIFYNNQTAMLKKPQILSDGLKKLLDSTYENIGKGIAPFTCLDNFDIPKLFLALNNLNFNLFKDRKLLGVVGSGINNIALQIDNKEVLCITDDFNRFQKRNFEDFDLPIIKKGYFDTNETSGWYIRKLGEPVTKKELNKLGKKITSMGYKLDDWRTEQACKIDNKIYLIDFECAQQD